MCFSFFVNNFNFLFQLFCITGCLGWSIFGGSDSAVVNHFPLSDNLKYNLLIVIILAVIKILEILDATIFLVPHLFVSFSVSRASFTIVHVEAPSEFG